MARIRAGAVAASTCSPWASERWYSPLSRFLDLVVAQATRHLVTRPAPKRPARAARSRERGVSATGVWQVSPTTDPIAIVLGAYDIDPSRAPGSLLVLVPTESWANRLRGRLEQRGLPVASGEQEWDRMRAGWPVVVGSRGAALAPVPRVAGAVLVDADDEAYLREAAPTWDAFRMVRERCRRDDAPWWATSMTPSPMLLGRTRRCEPRRRRVGLAAGARDRPAPE